MKERMPDPVREVWVVLVGKEEMENKTKVARRVFDTVRVFWRLLQYHTYRLFHADTKLTPSILTANHRDTSN